MAEVEETIKRLMSNVGMSGLIVANSDGIAIRTTLSTHSTNHHVSALHQLLTKACNAIKDLDHANELTFLRIRTIKNEIMVTSDKDYFMIAIQNAKSDKKS